MELNLYKAEYYATSESGGRERARDETETKPTSASDPIKLD